MLPEQMWTRPTKRCQICPLKSNICWLQRMQDLMLALWETQGSRAILPLSSPGSILGASSPKTHRGNIRMAHQGDRAERAKRVKALDMPPAPSLLQGQAPQGQTSNLNCQIAGLCRLNFCSVQRNSNNTQYLGKTLKQKCSKTVLLFLSPDDILLFPITDEET